MQRNQSLISRDNMFTVRDRLHNQVLRDIGATNQLDQDINIRVICDLEDISGDVGRTQVTIGMITTTTDLPENDVPPNLSFNFGAITFK